MKKYFLTALALLLTTIALMAQTGDIVSMRTLDTSPVSMSVEYSGTGSITANGTNLNNGSETFGITPDDYRNIIINATENVQLTYLNLFLYNKYLTQLNVSQAIYLTTLRCSWNLLTELDLTNNSELTELSCVSNALTELDVTNNTELTQLHCFRNQLNELDVTNNSKLIQLHCYINQLTELDVTNNTKLEQLNCGDNQLRELNVTNNPALTELSCSWNLLTELDLTNNTALKELNCSGNPLTELDVTNSTALTQLWCYSNRLTELDITNNTALTYLRCSFNRISSLDLSHNPNITKLEAESQLVTVAVLNGSTYFSNPIYYHNGVSVEDIQINGTTYAYGVAIPIPSNNTLFFNTNSSYEGNSFRGNINIVPGVRVKFVSNGGTEIEPIIAALGKPIGAITCIREEHILEGWYTEASFVNKWDLITDPVTEAMTLYAKWEVINGVENFNASSLNIYPNPATNQVTISGISTGDKIVLMDYSGRKIMELRSASQEQAIDVGGLSAGVYIISVNGRIGKLAVQ